MSKKPWLGFSVQMIQEQKTLVAAVLVAAASPVLLSQRPRAYIGNGFAT